MEDCTNNRQTHFRAIRQRCQLSPSPICTTKEEKKYTNTQKYNIRKYKIQILFIGQFGNAANYQPPQFAPPRKKGNTEIHKKYNIHKCKIHILIIGQFGSTSKYHPPQFAPPRKKGNTNTQKYTIRKYKYKYKCRF